MRVGRDPGPLCLLRKGCVSGNLHRTSPTGRTFACRVRTCAAAGSGVPLLTGLCPVFRLIRWHLQPIPVMPLICLLLLLIYGASLVALYRRGIRWPIYRSIFWLAGVISVLMVTATALDGYGMALFSIHMVQHMVLNMLSPVFLVLGAPVTLLLCALPVDSGRRGLIRRRILGLLHTRAMAILMHPGMTFFLFIMSLYGLYYTAAFDYLMVTWWGHTLMLLIFLFIGFIYFWAVLGIDPSPRTFRRGK